MFHVPMECSSPDEVESQIYKVQHFFRNKCSNILAELLARELRNCKFVKESLERNSEDTLNKSLFRLLKSVSSKGKKKVKKKDKCTTEETSTASQTQQINNLNVNEDVLGCIQVRQLLLEEGQADAAIERLGTLDSAFLLWILTNDTLEFPLKPEVKEALDILRKVRNSIHHRDRDKSVPEMLHMLCTRTKFLCKYLGRDDTCFQKYTSHVQNSSCPVFRAVQQEIHKSNCDYILPKHNQHYIVQLTIKHLRGYCRPDDIVENLMKFLAENQVCVSEESRPVLLCGVPGAGKSSILYDLVLSICEEQSGGGSFPLVVMVDEADTKHRTREKFWEHLFQRIIHLCPQAVEKYGHAEVMNVLSCFSSRNSFLFLMDQNLRDINTLNHLMPHMDHGMWVLSYQGVPELSTLYHVLKIESLIEGQVLQLLRGITTSEQCSLMFQLYRTCGYKGFIDTPEMVCIFAKVCLEIKGCVPFYRLIQSYIYRNIDPTDENERQLIELGRKAFDVIRLNKKYYPEKSLADIKSNVWRLFLNHDHLKGFFFKYRVVEDYLAAKYVVSQTEVACEGWLKQAPLFKRVFEIVCVLWSKQENCIHINLPYIKKYLEKLFEIVPCKKRRGKKKRQVNEPMEIDKTDNDDDDDNDDDGTNQNNFVRWTFLSKMAKDNQNNQDILLLLAELVACKHSWLFKCKSLPEKCIDNLSLVLQHVNLTGKLTIKLESGPNVTILTKLWVMLSSHQGVCSKTTVQIVIHYTETNWIVHEKLLSLFPATLVQTTVPLYITKYVGPLLCSGTEQFLNCLCMKMLDVLDVYVCDLGSLREVLAHKQELRSVIVRLNLRVDEMKIPNTMIQLSSYFLLNLTITYFEGLQALLDRIEPPHRLTSLRIYRVYIHEKFRLDLRRFRKLKFLSIRFLHMGRLPYIYMKEQWSEENMEVDDIKNNRKVSWLPLEQWTLQLVLNLHLPASLERLLMRNLSFCNDSNILILNRYWGGLPFQRLVLLDTHLSMSKFKEILQSLIHDSKVDVITESMEKKCRVEQLPESLKNAVKQERLEIQERKERRENKPEGKEVIITSDAKLCRECHFFSCTCVQPSINHSRNTYQDFVTLVNDIYSYKILSISYNSKDIILRKDMCGDLHVQCPLAFMTDEMVQWPELAQHPELVNWHKDYQEVQKLSQVLGVLALAQAISLTQTRLSHEGALYLLQHLKKRKRQFGTIEPFRITIFSRHYHTCPKSVEEVRHSLFMREVKNDDSLQQFNFRCDCMKRCHNFKKSIKGKIYFNDEVFNER